MNPADRKAGQSLSKIQTGIGGAVDAILNTRQPISHIKLAFVDTISPIQDSKRGVISVSEVHALLTWIHDILDNAVCKWVGNTAHILAHVFNSASRQLHDVWASQFPILHSPKDTLPPSEACLYGHMN